MPSFLLFFRSFCLLMSALALGACSTSSLTTRPIPVPSRVQPVTVATIAPPARHLVGVKSTVIVTNGMAGAPITVGFFWEQQDCENLRQSIIASLQGGSGPAGTGGTVLHVSLAEAGITRMDLPTCKITGSLTLTRSGRTIASRPVNITATVLSAVSVAKNKAIGELLGNIELLLQSAP